MTFLAPVSSPSDRRRVGASPNQQPVMTAMPFVAPFSAALAKSARSMIGLYLKFRCDALTRETRLRYPAGLVASRPRCIVDGRWAPRSRATYASTPGSGSMPAARAALYIWAIPARVPWSVRPRAG